MMALKKAENGRSLCVCICTITFISTRKNIRMGKRCNTAVHRKMPIQKRLHSSLETYLNGVESRQLISLGKPFLIRLYFVQSSNGDLPLGTLEIDMVHGRSAAARKGQKSSMLQTDDDVKSKLWPFSRNIRTNRTC